MVQSFTNSKKYDASGTHISLGINQYWYQDEDF